MSKFVDILYRIIGSRIKSRREELGISQEYLSSKIGIGRTSISNIELGRHKPPLHTIYKISDILDLDIQILLPTYNEVQVRIDFELTSELKELENIIKANPDLDSKEKIEIENVIKNLSDDK